MHEPAKRDWSSGTSQELRVLLESGASNADLDLLIQARRDGRLDVAQRLLLSTCQRPSSGSRANSYSVDDQALVSLRVAALRPVVNRLSAQELLRYIRFVHLASELLVEARVDDPFWGSESAVAAAATSLSQSALASLQAAG